MRNPTEEIRFLCPVSDKGCWCVTTLSSRYAREGTAIEYVLQRRGVVLVRNLAPSPSLKGESRQSNPRLFELTQRTRVFHCGLASCQSATSAFGLDFQQQQRAAAQADRIALALDRKLEDALRQDALAHARPLCGVSASQASSSAARRIAIVSGSNEPPGSASVMTRPHGSCCRPS